MYHLLKHLLKNLGKYEKFYFEKLELNVIILNHYSMWIQTLLKEVISKETMKCKTQIYKRHLDERADKIFSGNLLF